MRKLMLFLVLVLVAMQWTIRTVRYQFINVCGKIIRSGRRFYCRIINVTDEVFARFRHCQTVMAGT